MIDTATMSFAHFWGIGDYNGLNYHKGYLPVVNSQKPEYGEEIRDNEYYARKYADIFMNIFSLIEHGKLTFNTRQEEDEAWRAACNAYYRYKERADMYYARKHHCEEEVAESYRAKYARFPDWYKQDA